jgi:hypothetical protein
MRLASIRSGSLGTEDSFTQSALHRKPFTETTRLWADAKTTNESWNLQVSLELEKMKKIVSETYNQSLSTQSSARLSEMSASVVRKENVTPTGTPPPSRQNSGNVNNGRGRRNNKNQNVEKLLCTFFVNIPNDRTFLVTRKIIGPNGSHMKNIAKVCPNTKLRLRGKGSGYRDSQDKTESNVPLQINVSCSSNFEEYNTCKQEVSKLLNSIYAEYREFTGGKIVNYKLHENKKKNSPIAV